MPAPKRRPTSDTPEPTPRVRRADLSAAAGRYAAPSPLPPITTGAHAAPPSATSGAAAAPAELDRLVHERVRLGILSALAARPSATFTDLKALLGATDGNVSVHARKLEEAGYVACTKSFDGRVPRTEYRITPDGRLALDRYLDHMEALIRAARGR
ncbi:regulatory protein ArsR [Gemmatirosa kalamazoonensis]|uniref:Regulatory protein ArsR n=1 Tax=Gemmatirosa kalamazoonensis TaxID=861299 RepID=W0RCM3_9BACT|nr:transcriptional regulator [Gemmatirosa kalamazoonensis]AHG88546.1 regulatory protein ArsR [Gemmatirosa kalamazoonensis]